MTLRRLRSLDGARDFEYLLGSLYTSMGVAFISLLGDGRKGRKMVSIFCLFYLFVNTDVVISIS